MTKERINIAELLRECPTGMELDCVMFENVTLSHISESGTFPIKISTPIGKISLNKYGGYTCNELSKCVIFPKGKTTWEGFHKPFEDGDVIANNTYIVIFHKLDKIPNGVSNDVVYYHCWCHKKGDGSKFKIDFGIGHASDFRFATDKEKQKLFKVIKDNGYKWNSETKTLEKLVKPKFKAGDKIKEKTEIFPSTRTIYTYVKGIGYYTTIHDWIRIDDQDNWELVPNKFDINTLKPFESKVLVRDVHYHEWEGAIFGRYDGKSFFTIGGLDWGCCIPYEGNEHLFGTTNDCDDYYKNW